MSNKSLFLVLALATWVPIAIPSVAFGEHPTADPKVVAQDPDFGIQGEYVGPKHGMQVIARGEGEFDLVVYEGGLPGSGARAGAPRRIDGDEDVVADLVESMSLKRVERRSPTLNAVPPVGAVTLFDGTRQTMTEHWDTPQISDGGFLMQGTTSKDKFTDYTLHLEFRTPWMPDKTGQARGNSGVYHQSRYETQVLDSFGLEGRNNETGGIYSVRDPDLNMCFPPLQWQTYDVDFTAARFDPAGKKIANARMTVRLNGVVVQSDVEVPKSTTAAKMKEGSEPGPLYLQDHNAQVRYRNIWVLPRDAKREARRPIVPGFERFYAGASRPSIEAGEVLLSSLACDACHQRSEQALLPKKLGPDLTEVVSRIRLDALVAMIANPHQVKPGTTMPRVWHDLEDAQRESRAKAIASYLHSAGKGELIDIATNAKAADQGEKLYHQIGCVACHESFVGEQTPAATTVPLGDVARKYTMASLANLIQEPHQVRPGLRMPALVGSAENAFAIAAYLTREVTVRKSEAKFDRRVYRGKWSKLPDFDKLEPVSQDRVKGLKFNDINPQNDYGVVFEAKLPVHRAGAYEFVLSSDDGSRLRIGEHELSVDGIHPRETKNATFELQQGIHPIRIELFNAGGGAELELIVRNPHLGRNNIENLILDPDNPIPDNLLPSEFEPSPSLVQQGKQWFESSGCASCHRFGDQDLASSQAPRLDTLRPDHGCLADEVPAGAMDYELNPAQAAAIGAALEARHQAPPTFDDSQRVHLTMAALNCYACHSRGKLGGPEPNRDRHFQTRIPEMGLEGRLPPPLDGVGDKLNDTYVAQLLDHGANLRPYMLTRMPGYRYDALKPFHESLNRLDRLSDSENVESGEAAEAVLAAGRQAVGNRGLACIKCHSFGGNNGGGIGAIDMLKMNDRLREDWFHRYLQNPTKYRPGTRMPNSFVDGRSALTSLYDGDPGRQIDAMWRYLAQGKDAQEPEGLKEGAIVLSALDRPRIYRNFFQKVSGRGIGIGYPIGVNLIWDAESMTLAQLWKNSFVDASMHWRNRGQGRQQPLGDSIVALETSTPLAMLESIDGGWPDESGRERGFRFRGYRLDKSGNPTFRYSYGEITIDDSPIPGENNKEISRELVIHVPDSIQKPVIWQAVTGKIQQQQNVYQVDRGFQVTIDGVPCKLLQSKGQQAVRAVLPAGTTRIKETIRW